MKFTNFDERVVGLSLTDFEIWQDNLCGPIQKWRMPLNVLELMEADWLNNLNLHINNKLLNTISILNII